MKLSIGDLTTGLAFWLCAHSMRSRVYKTVRCPPVRLSVRQSVPSVKRSSGVRRVCCWAPYAQKISIDSAGRPAAAALQPGSAARRWAANAGNVMLTAELTRLNTDNFIIYKADDFHLHALPVTWHFHYGCVKRLQGRYSDTGTAKII